METTTKHSANAANPDSVKQESPTQTGHTLIPWSIGGKIKKCEIGGFTTIEATHNSPVAYVASLDDVAFIVTAVNSHQALLEALQELLEFCGDLSFSPSSKMANKIRRAKKAEALAIGKDAV